MRRVLPLPALVVLALALAACGEEGTPSTPPGAGDPPAAAPRGGGTAEASEPKTAKEDDAALDPAWWRRTPAVRLVLTGGERGVLKPCGCTATPRGGLGRAAAVLYRVRQAAAQGDTAVGALSLGWSLRGNREAQEATKADYLRGVQEALGYDAVLLGGPDLLVPAMGQPRGPGAGSPSPALNALLEPTSPALDTRGYAAFTVGSLEVRGFALVEPTRAQPWVARGFLKQVSSAAQALGGLNPKPEGVWIAAARPAGRGAVDEIRGGLKRLGAGILVDVTPSGFGQRKVDGYRLTPGGEPLVVELDAWGTSVGVLDFDPAPDGKGWVVAWRRIPLVARWDEFGGRARAAVEQLEGLYRTEVRRRDHLADFPRMPDVGPHYVGSSACAACHAAIYNDWKRTRHGLGLETLQKVGHDWDPDCLRCHVTGWDKREADGWIARKTGFRNPAKTPFLGGVGCESCHGPGSFHVARPHDRSLFVTRRGASPSPNRRTPGKAGCVHCHDPENSHGFAEGYEGRHLPAVDHRRVPRDLRTVLPEGAPKKGGK